METFIANLQKWSGAIVATMSVLAFGVVLWGLIIQPWLRASRPIERPAVTLAQSEAQSPATNSKISPERIWSISGDYWKTSSIPVGNGSACLLSDAPFSPELPQSIGFAVMSDGERLQFSMSLTSEVRLPSTSQVAVVIDGQSWGRYEAHSQFPKPGSDLKAALPTAPKFYGNFLGALVMGRDLEVRGSDFLVHFGLPGRAKGEPLGEKLVTCLRSLAQRIPNPGQ